MQKCHEEHFVLGHCDRSKRNCLEKRSAYIIDRESLRRQHAAAVGTF